VLEFPDTRIGDVVPIQSEDLNRLICGAADQRSAVGEILGHLGTTVVSICSEIDSLRADRASPSRIALVGPYLGRSLLEIACTALIARVDPFRVLVIREMQLRPDYSPHKRNHTRIQWSGDVQADGEVKELWRPDRRVSEMTRALLGDYYDHLIWRRAFQRVSDEVPDGRGGQWMKELRRTPPEGFISRIRQQSLSVYLSCSKGVHHEFVIPASSYYDLATLNSLLNDAVSVVATLGLVTNASRDVMFPLPLDDAISSFERLQMDADATANT
jgi:hypothetical protein